MPEISVNVEVYCAWCNNGLCNQTESTTARGRGEPCFRVDPCERCLERAREEGREDKKAELQEEIDDLRFRLRELGATP